MSLKSTGPPAVMQSMVNDRVAASVADVNSNWTDWILGAPVRLKHYQILFTMFIAAHIYLPWLPLLLTPTNMFWVVPLASGISQR